VFASRKLSTRIAVAGIVAQELVTNAAVFH
jgi:hypothetical protein